MKLFLTSCFILLSAAYALPFQTPVAGTYQCFSSEESLTDANAKDTGATLTINADGSYTFTTSNASENGSVQATENTTADLELAFQNGSDLILQPESGNPAYEGMFATDKQGGRYVFVFTNNGLILRCQSPGADIAAAIRQTAKDQVAAEQETQTPPEAVEESTQPSGETLTLNSGEVLSAGGQIEHGDYQCISEFYYAYSDTTNTREYLLSFYPDIGLRITEDDDDEDYTFVYNEATGELDVDGCCFNIDDNLINYFYDGYDGDYISFFKFYRDAQNKPVLYGERIDDTTSDDIIYTLCRYAGASQRPSIAQEKAARVEAERFKYVTAPGQGLQVADIKGVHGTSELVGVGATLENLEATYLLLNDGTVYKNLQVTPADLDEVASKKYESEHWGTWQSDGETITLVWNDSSESITFPDSADYFLDPAQSNERLNGTFGSVSGTSTGIMGMGGLAFTNYGSYIFSPDGRFDTVNYSTVAGTNTFGEMSSSTGYVTTEEGTVGGTSYSNTIGDVTTGITTSAETTNPNPPVTTGTYFLDGYTLELRYDDGRVERHFIYFYGAARDSINISGGYYSLPEN